MFHQAVLIFTLAGLSLISFSLYGFTKYPTNKYTQPLASDYYQVMEEKGDEHGVVVVAEVPKKKIILFTTKPNMKSKKFSGIAEAEKLCPRCIFTHDQKMWNQSDATYSVQWTISQQKVKVPWKAPGQVWIYYYRETPRTTPINTNVLKRYNNLFNWTITYRRDSDIFTPYAYLDIPTTPTYFDRDLALRNFQNKTKQIAWIVSHCRTSSKRERLVEKLATYLHVDIYGSCGRNKCPTSRSVSIGTDCRNYLSSNYKFYLAFENSLCLDYITEKFFDVIDTDMVPIVYGYANYTEITGIPKSSYINVADFASVKELAGHLLWLNNHPEEYVKYLEARAGITKYTVTEWCRICDKLYENDHGTTSHTYKSVGDWWKWHVDVDGGVTPVCVSAPDSIATATAPMSI